MKISLQFSNKLYLLNVGPSIRCSPFDDTLPNEARIPKEIKEETFYKFYVEGQVIYPIGKDLDLIGVNREGKESPLVAKIQITLVQHQLLAGKIITTGEYYVKEVVNKD